MKSIISIVFLFFILISCGDKKPSGILSADKMEIILWDLMLADETISYQATMDSTFNKKKKANELYNQIFALHKISKKEFQKNFQYYQSRPDLLKEILDSLSVKTASPRSLPLELNKAL